MVSFDINSHVIKAVIVRESHLGEPDTPFVFPTCSLGFVYPVSVTSSGKMHSGRLKINSQSNFPIHIPEKCFQLKFHTITLLAYQK